LLARIAARLPLRIGGFTVGGGVVMTESAMKLSLIPRT